MGEGAESLWLHFALPKSILQLFQEAVESPSVEVFKSHLVMVLGNKV